MKDLSFLFDKCGNWSSGYYEMCLIQHRPEEAHVKFNLDSPYTKWLSPNRKLTEFYLRQLQLLEIKSEPLSQFFS